MSGITIGYAWKLAEKKLHYSSCSMLTKVCNYEKLTVINGYNYIDEDG